ncbi:DUF732 domain-containing protein [Mycolicibacterium brisbanense]|nr:DUF732 domain-containing protein [Mycolicibacterium brisbanense]MCV7157990.1 DUF732 domain-containing protein [Mycolicibacterium brisbanense]
MTIAAAAPAHADTADIVFVDAMNQHGLGCGQGAIKCDDDSTLTHVGRSICYDIDVNGDSPVEAAQKLKGIAGDYISVIQAYEAVGIAIGAYCSWDQSKIPSAG